MEEQVLSQAGVWYSCGLAFFILAIAAVGAAIKDVRLANAANGKTK